ncbi:hypothetical protein D9M73_246300 [compost metagenome]
MQLGFKAADFSLERARVDLEQQVAFLDLGAFGEGHLIDLAGNTRSDFYRLRRFEAAGELVPLIDRLLQYLGDADLGRCGGLYGLRGATAGTHHQYCQ